MPDPLPREVLLERKLQRALIDLNSLRSMNKKLLRAGGLNVDDAAKEILTIVKNEKDYTPFLKPSAYKPVKLRSKLPIDPAHFEVAGTIWSDWHISEKVKLADSNEINAYSSTIAANRVWDLVDRTKKILTLHQSMYPLKKIHLMLLGDLINGSIHEELKFTNDLSDIAAAILAARIIVMAVIELLALGIPIQIDAVIGNHPRQSVHMPTKSQAQTNYDWLVYEMVSDCLKQRPDVVVRVHTGQMACVDVLGWRYVLEHGIDWKNGKEEDFEDKIRALFDSTVYREATGLKGTAFDMVCIGNLHKAAYLERTTKNGALVGQNELGQSWRLAPIRASQQLWGVSRSHIRTWQYSVDVTDIRDDSGSNPILDYTKGYMERNGR